MNLSWGAPAPCGPQIPPLATESMCVPSSLVQAPLSSGSFLEVDQGSPSSWFLLGSGDLVWDEEDIPSTSLCLSVPQQGCLQEEVQYSGEGEEEVSRALGAPSQISVFPGLCSSRKNLLVGSQSLPCTPMPALCLMTDQLGARGTGERGILFLVSHCRLALFSPTVHPGKPEWWQRGGRTLQALDDPAQRGCLEARTPGSLPSVQGTAPASQAWALQEPLALRCRSPRQMPPPCPLLQLLTPQVPQSPSVTQPVFAGWVLSAPPSQART